MQCFVHIVSRCAHVFIHKIEKMRFFFLINVKIVFNKYTVIHVSILSCLSCPEALQIWRPSERTFLERDFAIVWFKNTIVFIINYYSIFSCGVLSAQQTCECGAHMSVLAGCRCVVSFLFDPRCIFYCMRT